MITRIELKNFMSHEHTVIEPHRGLTVVAGPNNCGKSALITALQVLCYNDDSTFVTRHDAKDCSIKINVIDEQGEPHEIEWCRTKNKSTKYIIDGQQHDRLGRGGTPDVLQEILKIQKVECDNKDFDVHFGSQQEPVFLLNDSPRAAAQFFASSSDAGNLITMQSLHKQRLRDKRSEKKRLTVQQELIAKQLVVLEPLEAVNEQLEAARTQYATIQTLEEDIEVVNNLSRAIADHQQQLSQLASQTEILQTLPAPPELKPVEQLEESIVRFQSQLTGIELGELQCKALADLQQPPTLKETEGLEGLIETLADCETDVAVATSATSILGDLQAVPDLQPIDEIASFVANLQTTTAEFHAAKRRSDAFGQLDSPPAITDLSELETLVAQMTDTSANIASVASQHAGVQAELQTAQAGIETWVQSHPECPTCGGAITAETIIESGRHCDE